MEAGLKLPICTRKVYAVVEDRIVSVTIGIDVPIADPQHWNWWCVLRLDGIAPYLEQPQEEWRLGGVDGFDALANALEHIPRTLERTGLRWTRDPDRELAPGFKGIPCHGFSRTIAPGLPTSFRTKMEHLIKVEAAAAVKSGEMRHYVAMDRGEAP